MLLDCNYIEGFVEKVACLLSYLLEVSVVSSLLFSLINPNFLKNNFFLVINCKILFRNSGIFLMTLPYLL